MDAKILKNSEIGSTEYYALISQMFEQKNESCTENDCKQLFDKTQKLIEELQTYNVDITFVLRSHQLDNQFQKSSLASTETHDPARKTAGPGEKTERAEILELADDLVRDYDSAKSKGELKKPLQAGIWVFGYAGMVYLTEHELPRAWEYIQTAHNILEEMTNGLAEEFPLENSFVNNCWGRFYRDAASLPDINYNTTVGTGGAAQYFETSLCQLNKLRLKYQDLFFHDVILMNINLMRSLLDDPVRQKLSHIPSREGLQRSNALMETLTNLMQEADRTKRHLLAHSTRLKFRATLHQGFFLLKSSLAEIRDNGPRQTVIQNLKDVQAVLDDKCFGNKYFNGATDVVYLARRATKDLLEILTDNPRAEAETLLACVQRNDQADELRRDLSRIKAALRRPQRGYGPVAHISIDYDEMKILIGHKEDSSQQQLEDIRNCLKKTNLDKNVEYFEYRKAASLRTQYFDHGLIMPHICQADTDAEVMQQSKGTPGWFAQEETGDIFLLTCMHVFGSNVQESECPGSVQQHDLTRKFYIFTDDRTTPPLLVSERCYGLHGLYDFILDPETGTSCETPVLVDVAAVKLNEGIYDKYVRGKFKFELKMMPSSCSDDLETRFQGTEVVKIGSITGVTRGKIETMDSMHEGAEAVILIKSNNPNIIFARAGDSGSVILNSPEFDKANSTVAAAAASHVMSFGILCSEFTRRVGGQPVYCVAQWRHCLQALEHYYGLKLQLL